MADYTIDIVDVSTASISPNPVNANAKFTLSVKITESTKVLEPAIIYLDEIYMGEVW